ncbi:MAG TPA: GNAT family N-acetyltransferase [Acidimicrobiales bacterium]|nr:GNAT family N-acetyltransferase [Acidimicrobiales bacterium]
MTTEVTDSKDRSRYELTVDGELAGFAAYRDMKGTRVFTHTEVFPAFGGRGLGSILVRSSLDEVRGRGGTLVALCPFVDRFVREHAEYGDLVDADLDVRLRD